GPGPEGLDRLLTVLETVREEYVEPVDEGKLMQGAARGLVEALGDPYSAFIEPSQFRETMIHTSGTYQGVGISVTEVGRYVTVVSVFRGTPAFEAGLRSGDRLIRVNGQDVVGTPIDQVVELIRGPEGTEVTLTLLRGENDQEIVARLKRSNIRVPTVESRMLEGKVGYLAISQFLGTTSRDVGLRLKALEQEGMKGLVLDLRNNPGGLLDQAVKVAQYFVPEGPIVSVVDRQGEQFTYRSQAKGFKLPLAVLIDGGSASAAEVLAGAIQDRGVGKLVGTRTFGKVAVQNLHRLADGSGLRITTARYYPPSGRKLDQVGLEPDLEVPASEAREAGREGAALAGDAAESPDPQLEAAVELVLQEIAARG
ncbi:MAG: S41 family peptidase, partial [Acetobacteraceae bacterium]|nr:S41 family peptidase [Acetobacteraceae bacterium]